MQPYLHVKGISCKYRIQGDAVAHSSVDNMCFPTWLQLFQIPLVMSHYYPITFAKCAKGVIEGSQRNLRALHSWMLGLRILSSIISHPRPKAGDDFDNDDE